MTWVGRHAPDGSSRVGVSGLGGVVVLGLAGLCMAAAAPELVATAPEHLDLLPIIGPEPVPEPPSFWTAARIVALAAVAAAAMFTLWVAFRPRRPPPELPPHEWALRELERLSGPLSSPDHDPSAAIARRAGCAGVADLVRRFLERRFAIPAPEQTTPELLAAIARTREIDGVLRQSLDHFFQQADLVKFTGLPCTGETAIELLEKARAIVQMAAPGNGNGNEARRPDAG